MSKSSSLVILLVIVHVASSINVLLFLLGTNQFERNTFEFLAQQLALRHHEVTTVKPILIPEEPRLVKPKLHLVKEKTLKNLLPPHLYKPLEKVGQEVPWKDSYEVDAYQYPYWKAHNYSCHKMLNSNLMDTIRKEKINVAIVYAGNPCQLAIVHTLGLPYVYFDVDGFTDETVIASGSPWNLDGYATRRSPSRGRPNFGWRLLNGYHLLREAVAQNAPSVIAKMVSKRYANLDHPINRMFANDYEIKKKFRAFPDVNKIKQAAEVYFVNTDPLLEDGTSFPPNVIPVGGLHIDYPKPLFDPWKSTIEAAESGVIVVSLGTQADSSQMSKKHAKAILGALSKFTKYRIYWRIGPNFELPGVDLDKLPGHINLTTFIPQVDLLAHKACRLLITNGGMSSIMEAVAFGVPIVGIPLYGVNFANLQKIQNKGLGVIVDKQQLSSGLLAGAMKDVLDSKLIADTAKSMSKEFQNRGSTAFDRALHYIEHVGRHQGARFFKPSRAHVASTFTRGANLDFWISVLLTLAVAGVFAYTLTGMLFRFVSRHGPPPGSAGIEVAKSRGNVKTRGSTPKPAESKKLK